jgi:hypothetical protein
MHLRREGEMTSELIFSQLELDLIEDVWNKHHPYIIVFVNYFVPFILNYYVISISSLFCQFNYSCNEVQNS